MTLLLNILIPTLRERRPQFVALEAKLQRQVVENNLMGSVAIISCEDNREQTTGAKRNLLLYKATGLFVVFVDDDDDISEVYIPLIYNAIQSNPEIDCIGFHGTILFRGKHQRRFVHSLRYTDYATLDGIYCRPPYHLNPIRRDIAIRYPFKDTNYSEDVDWALRLRRDRALTREYFIESPLYCYRSRRFWLYQSLLDRTETVRHLLGLRFSNRFRLWQRRPPHAY